MTFERTFGTKQQTAVPAGSAPSATGSRDSASGVERKTPESDRDEEPGQRGNAGGCAGAPGGDPGGSEPDSDGEGAEPSDSDSEQEKSGDKSEESAAGQPTRESEDATRLGFTAQRSKLDSMESTQAEETQMGAVHAESKDRAPRASRGKKRATWQKRAAELIRRRGMRVSPGKRSRSRYGRTTSRWRACCQT